MATPTNNLFLRLHKWASRQDENFVTESLAVLLEHLLVLAPAVGMRLVTKLTDGCIPESEVNVGAIEILTQVEELAGRPDLEIKTTTHEAWVKVKVEAELGSDQLKRYRDLLSKKSKQTKLLLLTKYPHESLPKEVIPIRWFELAGWLEKEIEEVEDTSEVARFLVRQFLDFLEAKGMKLSRVEWYMPEELGLSGI